jgi:hypothetical protein
MIAEREKAFLNIGKLLQHCFIVSTATGAKNAQASNIIPGKILLHSLSVVRILQR